MMFEKLEIDINLIDLNTGQITGLPCNPRWWTFEDIERLKKSIEQTPELLEIRQIIVYPYKERFVAIGGNLRLSALKEMGAKSVRCFVLHEDVSIDCLKEIAIKDNSSFGNWNDEALQIDWSDVPLLDWGVDSFINVEEGEHDDEKKKDSLTNENSVHDFVVQLSADELSFVLRKLRSYDKVKETALLKVIEQNEI